MLNLEWSSLRASELHELSKKDAIVIVPVGSTEQHGPHLPVGVDAILAGEVALRAAKVMVTDQPVVVTPIVWLGLAEHHMPFGGTLTIDVRSFRALLKGVCMSLARHGFRRILLLNGHGGNIAALDTIAAELAGRLGIPITMRTYWLLAEHEFSEILEIQTNVLHAGEAETSMLLALNPELVDTTKLGNGAGALPRDSWQEIMRSTQQGVRWMSMTNNGVVGDPSTATPAKGERLLRAAAEAVAKTLQPSDLWLQNEERE